MACNGHQKKKSTTTTTTTTTTALATEEECQAAISSCKAAGLLAGDVAAGATTTSQAFEKWLALVRRRSGKYRFSGFPNRHPQLEGMLAGSLHSFPLSSSWLSAPDIFEQTSPGGQDCDLESPLSSEHAPEISLWERLGNAATLDIECGDFSWNMFSSLHHTEHSSSTELSEDDMCKPLEVTVNSGGVVFFALFDSLENNVLAKETAAVIKIASSRMATQSERLGYEFAKWLGVQTPQARVIHNSSLEWQRIKDAAEKAKDMAASVGDESGEMACSELLEALELSRCLLLMNYIHGSPLLDAPYVFDSKEVAEKTAAALGRILMLDLVLRNEDRLPCHQLGWRGNPANLLFADKAAIANLIAVEDTIDSDTRRFQPQVIKELCKERRSNSVDGRLGPTRPDLISEKFDTFDGVNPTKMRKQSSAEIKTGDFHIIAIDSGVPRRPPAGKRAKDQSNYPKLVELMLNSAVYSSNLLYEITGGKVGHASIEDVGVTDACSHFSKTDIAAIVREFRGGFRAALRDLQGFYLFLLTLYQKLDGLLRLFLTIINKNSIEVDKDDCDTSELSAPLDGCSFSSSPTFKDRNVAQSSADSSDLDQQKSAQKSPSPRHRDSPDTASPVSRENWSGRYSRGSGEPRSLRLTMKLRDFNKNAKVDSELNKELEQWNEMLKTDVIKLCHENNFNTGFFEGSDTNIAVDAYELKVRLEHILERITLISDAANTERPSHITGNLFIAGALSARSVHTLEHLGITHILCLCSNEIGQSDSQYPDLFEYRNFSIDDNEDAEISNLFDATSDYIDYVDKLGCKVLVHCFEGRSRSATVVLAYLMLRKNLTLLEAWNMLKKVHRRAQPNDGFAKILLELDKKLHGKASMEWQHKRPMMRVCPICGKDAGLSSSSLKLHLQKSHRKISSGSVDSAMTMEIQRALDSLKLNRSGSISPNSKQSQSFINQFT